MHRTPSLKPRTEGALPAEKLLSILRGIYPEEMAIELFNGLQKGGDPSAVPTQEASANSG